MKSNARLKQLDVFDYFNIPKIYLMMDMNKSICVQVICYICASSFVVLSKMFQDMLCWRKISYVKFCSKSQPCNYHR